MRLIRSLPLLLLGACGGQPGCASPTHAQKAKPATTTTSADPALPGLGAGDPVLEATLRSAFVAKGLAYKPNTRHLNPDGSPKYTNRLILQTSPYLLQHAHNPVNWNAWGDEAFTRARQQGKPILLSIGYSTCHWCHVMEHESFEDDDVATFINQHFIAIKVDREERPDIDDVYMAAVQMLSGGGGWPMTVALTPDRQPFFGGTYFPARDGDRGAKRGFLTVLQELASEYAQDRGAVVKRAGELSRRLKAAALPAPAEGVPGPELLAEATRSLAQTFDATWGGFGRAPKFPRPVTLELLLRYQRRTGDTKVLDMVVKTLDAMARGGVYDQVGGGFHRYATDAHWLVPHFEKMLYDNAQLVPVYLSAYQATGRDDLAKVARDTLDYVGREMTSPDGAFFSATDADSRTPSGNDEEGWFFTWTPTELGLAVGPALLPTVSSFYGVTVSGNFDGRSILHVPRPPPDVAKDLGLTPAELMKRIQTARALLYEARVRRPSPRLDDKILTSWNGLMISAMAKGALVLGNSDYQRRAERAASFVLRELRGPDGQLNRSFHSGQSQLTGYLDDYSFFIQALLDLFETSGDPRWLGEAIALQKTLDRLYADDSIGGYFATTAGHEQLLTRDKPSYDGAEPAGNSVAVFNLLRLAELTSDLSYRKRAEQALSAFAGALRRSPAASPLLLSGLEAYLDTPREIVLVSPSSKADSGPLLTIFRRAYLPNRFLVRATEGENFDKLVRLVPALGGKEALGGRVTAFVCERGLCERPTTDALVFAKQLAKVSPFTSTPPN